MTENERNELKANTTKYWGYAFLFAIICTAVVTIPRTISFFRDGTEFYGASLWIPIAMIAGTIVIGIIWTFCKSQFKPHKQDSNEENTLSYTDENTGRIVLFAYDWPKKENGKWVVENGTITISGTDDTKKRIIPLSKIYNLGIDRNLGIYNLSFKISGEPARMLAGNTTNPNIPHEIITFKDSDLNIAKEILKRFSNISNTATVPNASSNPSTAVEIARFKALLDEGVITREEFDHKKRELLGM